MGGSTIRLQQRVKYKTVHTQRCGNKTRVVLHDLPRNFTGFLAAGRILSSDRLSNSALRVQATCMATGQAAGAAAALAVRNGIEPRDVAMPELRALLEANGAIVP